MGFYYWSDFQSDFCPLFGLIPSFLIKISDRESYRNFVLGNNAQIHVFTTPISWIIRRKNHPSGQLKQIAETWRIILMFKDDLFLCEWFFGSAVICENVFLIWRLANSSATPRHARRGGHAQNAIEFPSDWPLFRERNRQIDGRQVRISRVFTPVERIFSLLTL